MWLFVERFVVEILFICLSDQSRRVDIIQQKTFISATKLCNYISQKFHVFPVKNMFLGSNQPNRIWPCVNVMKLPFYIFYTVGWCLVHRGGSHVTPCAVLIHWLYRIRIVLMNQNCRFEKFRITWLKITSNSQFWSIKTILIR